MAAIFADSAGFTIKIRQPHVLAAALLRIGTGDRPILIGQWTGVCIGEFQGILYLCFSCRRRGNSQRFGSGFPGLFTKHLVIGRDKRGGQSFDHDSSFT